MFTQQLRGVSPAIRGCFVAAAAVMGTAEGANIEQGVYGSRESVTAMESGEQVVVISVKGTNWGTGVSSTIKAVLENVAWHMTRHLRDRFDAVVEVENSAAGPMIELRMPSQTVYRIHLKTKNQLWAQYSYQFAHEFCHLLSNYEQRFGKPNQWIEESVCEMAALFTLRSMGVTWKQSPPYPQGVNFAKHLTEYAATEARKVETQTPEGEAWEGWFLGHEASSRSNPYNRVGNRIVALRMLPLFEEDPTGWNAIRRLPASEATIDEFLAQWKEAADSRDRAFIERIQRALRPRSRQRSP